MPAYRGDSGYGKVSLRRMILTAPFLAVMVFSLLPLGMYGFSWLRGKMVWNKTEAVVTMIPSEESVYYSYLHKETSCDGSLVRPKLLFFIPYGEHFSEGDAIDIAYKMDDPKQHVVFFKQECYMLTWAIIFGVSAVLYIIIDTAEKKALHLTG